jgi:hypothetical protein
MRLNELKSVNYGRQELFSGLQKDWFSMCNLYKKANLSAPIENIGKVNNFQIQRFNSQREMIRIVDTINNKSVGFITTNKVTGTKNVREPHCAIKLEYSGMNIVTKVYAFLIKKLNYILWTRHQQTPQGQKLWERLAKISGIIVFAYDTKKKKAISLDKDDIFGEDAIFGSFGNSGDKYGKSELTFGENEYANYYMTLVAAKDN